jgi:mono/diheme cytochrome c family protein
MMLSRLALAAALLLVVCAGVRGDPPAKDQPDAKPLDAGTKAFLQKHCFGCHAGAKPKGGIALDKLSADLGNRANRDVWLAALEQVKAGAMPPEGKSRPDAKEFQAVQDWVTGRLEAAEVERRSKQGRATVRRLNRVEYENTIRDLLGIDVELKELLPPDATANGFDTSGDAHHVSQFLMESYLEAADKAFGFAIANLPKPPVVKKRYSLKDERIVKISTESVYRQRDDEVTMFSSSAWNTIVVGQFYPPDRGRYRVRISAQAVQSDGKPVAFRVDVGPMLMGTKNHLVSYFDAPAKEPKVFEFVDHFEARNHFRVSPYGLATAQTVNKIGADKYTGLGLAVQWVEVEGPIYDTWPPECHTRIFGDLPQVKAPTPNFSNRVEVTSKDPEADAARILKAFAGRAFRRTVTDADIEPYRAIVRKRLAEKYSFEASVRVALKGMLVSPEFLFLRETPGALDDFALASRLSYFLWSSMPDEPLLKLAAAGKLSNSEVLRGQLERMLNSPKARQFTENFCGQWLGLRDIDFTAPDYRLYPEFDEALKVAMLDEAHLYFDALLKADLSVSHLVASDFTFVNGRLAKHYGIPDVDGMEMRRVNLPPNLHRGGFLTMAGVLKVSANGTNTSPVVRGAWVLDRLLGQPPAPPPAGVPAVEPDIRGSTTIRDQLAKHRSTPTCNACHAKIDPPGFALENFDVIGGWRESYRSIGSGKPVFIDGRRMMYAEGKKIDPSDEFHGEKFANIDGLRTILLKDKDQLARALTEKLVAYATGSAPTALDKPEIEAIVRNAREKNFGVRAIVHEVVQSKLFRHK